MMPDPRTDPQTAARTRRAVRFTGRVQGVGFRATASAIARGHDVTGWVRNEADGSVLLEAQGPPDAVDAYLDDVRHAMSACIAGEDASDAPLVAGESSFEVRM